jgi:hypothetical protein
MEEIQMGRLCRLRSGLSLDHSLHFIFYGVAGIMHIHQKKNEGDKQNDEELHNALKNGIEKHNNQNHTNAKV